VNPYIGRLVTARRDLHAGWLPSPTPRVKRGARGIIRDIAAPGGFFSGPKYVVEFLNGAVLDCDTTRDVRLAWFAGGERDFAARKTVVDGVRIGMAVLTVIAVIPLIPYFLQGGSLSDLIVALPGAIVMHALDLSAFLGLPAFLICVGGFFLWKSVRRR
jgi:hypothetical protein